MIYWRHFSLCSCDSFETAEKNGRKFDSTEEVAKLLFAEINLRIFLRMSFSKLEKKMLLFSCAWYNIIWNFPSLCKWFWNYLLLYVKKEYVDNELIYERNFIFRDVIRSNFEQTHTSYVPVAFPPIFVLSIKLSL